MYAKGPRELQTNGVEAASFEALADIAVASLQGERNLVTVCGPISTGGTGDQKHNFDVFNAVIRGLERQGKKLFNQIPYEFGLRKLAYAWEAEGNTGYCMPILTVFYARIFETGAIGDAYFIPGWRSSFGARWEREKLTQVRCAVHDLTHQEIRSFLHAEYPPAHVGAVMALIPD